SALAPQLDARLATGLGAADDARKLVRARDRLAVELHDDVACLDARLLRRSALLDGVHQGAGGLRQAARPRELLGPFLYHYADPAPAHPAVLPKLPLDLHRDVDRDRERQPHEPPGPAVDLRVDADHLAAHIEQRPAGVARIDRDVGLDEGNKVLLREAAPLRAHDARGDGAREAEGRADRDHPFSDLEPVRVAHLHRGQAGRVDLDEREIGALVRADHTRLELALVG